MAMPQAVLETANRIENQSAKKGLQNIFTGVAQLLTSIAVHIFHAVKFMLLMAVGRAKTASLKEETFYAVAILLCNFVLHGLWSYATGPILFLLHEAVERDPHFGKYTRWVFTLAIFTLAVEYGLAASGVYSYHGWTTVVVSLNVGLALLRSYLPKRGGKVYIVPELPKDIPSGEAAVAFLFSKITDHDKGKNRTYYLSEIVEAIKRSCVVEGFSAEQWPLAAGWLVFDVKESKIKGNLTFKSICEYLGYTPEAMTTQAPANTTSQTTGASKVSGTAPVSEKPPTPVVVGGKPVSTGAIAGSKPASAPAPEPPKAAPAKPAAAAPATGAKPAETEKPAEAATAENPSDLVRQIAGHKHWVKGNRKALEDLSAISDIETLKAMLARLEKATEPVPYAVLVIGINDKKEQVAGDEKQSVEDAKMASTALKPAGLSTPTWNLVMKKCGWQPNDRARDPFARFILIKIAKRLEWSIDDEDGAFEKAWNLVKDQDNFKNPFDSFRQRDEANNAVVDWVCSFADAHGQSLSS